MPRPPIPNGQQIRRAREAQKWSQVQLGKAIKRNQRTVSALEVGQYRPTPLIAARLHRVLPGLAALMAADDAVAEPDADRELAAAS